MDIKKKGAVRSLLVNHRIQTAENIQWHQTIRNDPATYNGLIKLVPATVPLAALTSGVTKLPCLIFMFSAMAKVLISLQNQPSYEVYIVYSHTSG